MILYTKQINRVEVPNSELAKEFRKSKTMAKYRGELPILRIFSMWLSDEKKVSGDWEGEGREQALFDQDEIIDLALK